jgi:predicted membrane-bound spermidine synthase
MLSRLQKSNFLDAVAFTTGFCLMAYELVASRLLAPAIGSSTYVWTSVIGVIIAALSLGYSVGGVLADKRVRVLDIAYLLIISACCMLTTVILAPGTLQFISTYIADPRFQGLTASLLLFMPTSFVVGMISPYLVRLRISAVSNTGRSAASLSALNAIGGIMGTFCAGFLFFGYIGARETIGILCVLLLIMSWCVQPGHNTKFRCLMTAVALLLAINAYAPKTNPAIRNIDTPSAHYQVIDGAYNRQPVRVLATGPYGAQSGVFKNTSGLVFPYTKQIAALVDQAPRKQRILVLGGGTFTLPQYIGSKYPQSHIDVIEIDPQLLPIAQQYFGYHPSNNVRHIFSDARAYLNDNTASYDIIIVDVYGDTSVPFAVTTTQYVNTLRKRLSPNGVVVANVIAAPTKNCTPLLAGLHSAYAQYFTNYRAFTMLDWSRDVRQNLVITYSNQPLSWASHHYPEVFNLPRGTPFSDNFAPIERYEQQCGHW